MSKRKSFLVRQITSQQKRSFLIRQITSQQTWIESCESNGKSYTGPNGGAIRQADVNHLLELERELGELS